MSLLDFFTEVESDVKSRNMEVIDKINSKLDQSCRFVYNFFTQKKLQKMIIKMSKHKARWEQAIILGTFDSYLAIDNLEKLSNAFKERQLAIDAMFESEPCEECSACLNIKKTMDKYNNPRKYRAWRFRLGFKNNLSFEMCTKK